MPHLGGEGCQHTAYHHSEKEHQHLDSNRLDHPRVLRRVLLRPLTEHHRPHFDAKPKVPPE